MSQISQILNYVKNITERLNLYETNAKKVEELPMMSTANPLGLLLVSELEAGIYKSKKLQVQKIIDAISLAGQDNQVREILLGSITVSEDLNYLLNNTGISVAANEIVVLTALTTINNTLVQKQYLWKLGKGNFNPIGSTSINTKLLELQPKFIDEIVANELTSSPQSIVYEFGVITDTILNVLNTASPARNYIDSTKIYYIRATKDGVNLLYNFIGTNGTYGAAASQIATNDLVLVYSTTNSDILSLINGKLDKSTYTGTAQTLSDWINALKTSIIPLKSQFTLVQKSTENTNNSIEINDYARGFGPGTGADLEYWNMAEYLNLTGDNNVNNYLNYKPITVSLPNS
jgi:hypothetical protein